MKEVWEMVVIGLIMVALVGLSLLCGYKIRGVVDQAQCSADNIVVIH